MYVCMYVCKVVSVRKIVRISFKIQQFRMNCRKTQKSTPFRALAYT